MDIRERVEKIVSEVRPVLLMQEKDAEVVEATAEGVRIELKGFCGGCGCSQDYVDGLREMIAHELPEVGTVDIVVA